MKRLRLLPLDLDARRREAPSYGDDATAHLAEENATRSLAARIERAVGTFGDAAALWPLGHGSRVRRSLRFVCFCLRPCAAVVFSARRNSWHFMQRCIDAL